MSEIEKIKTEPVNPLLESVTALKKIQYVYGGAGNSFEDLIEVKKIAIEALQKIGMFDMSMAEFGERKREFEIKQSA